MRPVITGTFDSQPVPLTCWTTLSECANARASASSNGHPAGIELRSIKSPRNETMTDEHSSRITAETYSFPVVILGGGFAALTARER
jgi:hypothetical protein